MPKLLYNQGGNMIDKLSTIDEDLRNYFAQTKPDVLALWDKVNEIIEVLNKLTDEKTTL